MNKKNFRSPGFTLVELLVVISIIALLLSILMPSLNKAREQAIRIVCASNMKTTGTSMCVYLDDYKGALPPDYMPPRASGTGQDAEDDFTKVFWQQKLVPYTQNGKVFTCSNYEKYFSKSFANLVPKSYLYGQKNKDMNWYYWYCSGTAPSFGYNHRAFGCGGYAPGYGCYSRPSSLNSEAGMRLPVLQVKMSQIRNASNSILCLDNVSSFAIPPSGYTPLSRWREVYHPKRFLHNKGVNILYVDGHAEWKTLIGPKCFEVDSLNQDDSSWGNCHQDPSQL